MQLKYMGAGSSGGQNQPKSGSKKDPNRDQTRPQLDPELGLIWAQPDLDQVLTGLSPDPELVLDHPRFWAWPRPRPAGPVLVQGVWFLGPSN